MYVVLGFRPVGMQCLEAVRLGDLKLLIAARAAGEALNSGCCDWAAFNGHLHILTYIGEQESSNCPWGTYTCAAAAAGGHLGVLQYLRQAGCPWNALTCANAAGNGRLDILQWARDAGCPWDKWTCNFAGSGGHLGILQWARGGGCPWDKWVCKFADEYGYRDVLFWAADNGCPWSPAECPQLLVRKLVQEAVDGAVRNACAVTIQDAWQEAYYNPARAVCRRRLLRQFHDLPRPLTVSSSDSAARHGSKSASPCWRAP